MVTFDSTNNDVSPPLCEFGDRADCTVCSSWPDWLRHTPMSKVMPGTEPATEPMSTSSTTASVGASTTRLSEVNEPSGELAYARAINLLVQASRVSPPLRQAVAAVEAEVDRLTNENVALNRHVLELIGFIECRITDLNPEWLAGVRADAEAALTAPYPQGGGDG